MIEIAAAVCLISEPQRCKDISLTYEPDVVSIYDCFYYGQTELAKWTDQNPHWRIAKWRCGTAGRTASL